MDTDRVHKRTLWVLWAAAVFGRGAVSATFPIAVLAIAELLGSDTFAGLSTAASTVGGALAAAVLATVMQRVGRNPGLSGGFAAAAVGALVCLAGVEIESLPLFVFGMVLVGVGSGTSRLSRYAAADLAPEHRRARDIGSVIFASTFGAVLFPLFIGTASDSGVRQGLAENSGGFILGAALFALAGLAVFVFMRPDPLVIAGGLVSQDGHQAEAVPFIGALKIAWGNRYARLALIAMVVAQAVMVMVMAMTPLHMKAHGHEAGIIGAVISAHTAGMFAFAPIAGRLSDSLGRVRVILLGSGTLGAATVLTALAGEAPALLMFPGLFLLGLGWSFGIVAGSALLTEAVPDAQRVAVQGAADTATNIASGVGALASGLVLSMAGFHILSMIGIFGAGLLGAHTLFEDRLATLRS